jgi:hypothetical protein
MKKYQMNKYRNHYKSLPYLFLMTLLLSSLSIFSQNRPPQGLLNPSPAINEERIRTVVLGEVAITAAATSALYFLWYKGFKHSRFHFFNDNNEWLNMDKVGHATSAYNIAAGQYDLMRWSGVDNKKASIIAGLSALGYMSIIEVLDGFSEKWGFSKGDMLANLTGSGVFVAQQMLWKQQRVQMRVSFHSSIYAKYNTAEFGKNWRQRLMKDYNGQTYWLSFNISSFLPTESNFPRWMTADVGYGAEGMIGGRSNPSVIDGMSVPEFERYRKFYLGIGGEFKKPGKDLIPFPLWGNILRYPSPAVEFKLNTFKPKLKLLYY